MEKFFEEYLTTLDRCHSGILETVEGLPESALNWQPDPNMNSIAVLIYHLTGAERFWIGDVVDQTPSGRDREAEFKVKNVGLDVLRNRLDENLKYIRGALEKLSLADLAETRLARDGQTVTVAWALLHAIEHSGIHRGHIEIMRQLWQDSQNTSGIQ